MSRNNYRQAKRNREETRKKRQVEKQQRKLARNDGTAPEADKDTQEAQPAPGTPA